MSNDPEDSEDSKDMLEFFKEVMDDEEINNFLKTVMLFQDDKNVHLKSEVHHPFMLSQLQSLSDFLGDKDFEKTQKVFNKVLSRLLQYRVSYNRKSRDEMGEAIRSFGGREKQEVEDKLDRLLEA